MQITNDDLLNLLKPHRQTSDAKVIFSITDQCSIYTCLK
jgi:hypothetical protein